ncbi:MAG: tRNA-(ms[2]io[6]A)-hydroxylase [Pseudomonadales bacterium]
MSNPLKIKTSSAWVESVISDFDRFLNDHAANEKKASSMAMSMVAHYPDRIELLENMVDLALEELNHYRQVLRIMLERGITPLPDEKDMYVNQLVKQIRKGSDHYFIDRLLSAAVIEARGAERFTLLGQHLQEPALASFYKSLAKSESNHFELFLNLAKQYFPTTEVETRFEDWLVYEATAIANCPIHPKLH